MGLANVSQGMVKLPRGQRCSILDTFRAFYIDVVG